MLRFKSYIEPSLGIRKGPLKTLLYMFKEFDIFFFLKLAHI